MREVTVRTGSAERAHVPEYASRSCSCSCNRDTCVAGEPLAGAVPSHPILAVADPQGTSARCPYSVHSSHFPSGLCYVGAVASLSDLKSNNKKPVKFLNTLKYGICDFIVKTRKLKNFTDKG